MDITSPPGSFPLVDRDQNPDGELKPAVTSEIATPARTGPWPGIPVTLIMPPRP